MDETCACGCAADSIPFTIGDVVPEEIDFSVFQNGDIITKSFNDYRGKWTVLFFYPGDFTFVCPTELAELADLYAKFQAEEAEIIAVSTDSAFVHKAWHDTSESIAKVEYPMASDQNHALSYLFGTLIPEEGKSLRGTFIISPDGVIKSIEVNDNAIGRCAAETLRKLKAAKYVSNNPANVCPASWVEGDDAMTEDIDLVGKI